MLAYSLKKWLALWLVVSMPVLEYKISNKCRLPQKCMLDRPFALLCICTQGRNTSKRDTIVEEGHYVCIPKGYHKGYLFYFLEVTLAAGTEISHACIAEHQPIHIRPEFGSFFVRRFQRSIIYWTVYRLKMYCSVTLNHALECKSMFFDHARPCTSKWWDLWSWDSHWYQVTIIKIRIPIQLVLPASSHSWPTSSYKPDAMSTHSVMQ